MSETTSLVRWDVVAVWTEGAAGTALRGAEVGADGSGEFTGSAQEGKGVVEVGGEGEVGGGEEMAVEYLGGERGGQWRRWLCLHGWWVGGCLGMSGAEFGGNVHEGRCHMSRIWASGAAGVEAGVIAAGMLRNTTNTCKVGNNTTTIPYKVNAY